jgi:hypothetical protein
MDRRDEEMDVVFCTMLVYLFPLYEFTVVFPDVDEEHVRNQATRIRMAVRLASKAFHAGPSVVHFRRWATTRNK